MTTRMFERESSLCFNSTDFERESFNADAFVSNHGRLMDLDSLLKDLKSYHNKIKFSLIEVINSDYQDFVGLSKTLATAQSSIEMVQKPLTEWNSKVTKVRNEMQKLNTDSENILSEKRSCQQRKQQLVALKSVYTILNFLENSLFDSAGNKIEISDTSALKRISLEMSSLNSKLVLCEPHSVSDTVRKRCSEISEHFLHQLSKVFTLSIASSDEESLINVLHIYSTIEKLDEAYNVYRHKCVQPYLTAKVTFDTSSKISIENIYQDILNYFPEKALFLMRAVAKPQAGIKFDFEIYSVFVEAVELLIRKCSQIFIPVNWRQFGARYRASMEFLSNFENQLHSEDQVMLLRNSSSYKQFCDKWSLPVYFQLIFQEIVSRVENCIATKTYCKNEVDSSGGDANSSERFNLSVSNEIYQCFCLCWSDEAYINSLAHKNLKLSLQLSLRFLQWTQISLKDFNKRAINSNVSQSSYSVDKMDRTNVSSIDSSEASNVTDSSKKSEFEVHKFEEFLTCVISDVDRFLSGIQTIYDLKIYREIKGCSSQQNQDQKPSNADPFKSVKSQLNAELSKMYRMEADLVIVCLTDSLKPISDTPRLYRKMHRPVPEMESTYIINVVTKLKHFFDDTFSTLPTHSNRKILLIVADEMSSQMQTNVKEVCDSVDKIDQGLKKIQSSMSMKNLVSAENGNDSSRLSDSEKIFLQLYLDVGYYVENLARLGNEYDAKINKLESTKALLNQIEFASFYRDKILQM